MDPFDLSEYFRNPEEMLRQQQERLAQAEELQRRVNEAVGTATSEDERITVTFSEANGIEELRLDPRVMRMSSEELAEQLRGLLNDARKDAQRQIEQIVQEVAPQGTVDPDELIERLPTLESDLDEMLRATQSMGVQVDDLAERMRRIADSS